MTTDYGVPVPFEDYQESKQSVVLDYTNRDYAAIRSQMIGLARGLMPEWETVGEESDFGTLLVELFAYMGDVMHFYIDRAAGESSSARRSVSRAFSTSLTCSTTPRCASRQLR